MKLFQYKQFLDSVNESDGGKGIFTSFMKTLTALGMKHSQPNWEKCPSDYLLFYYYPDLDAPTVKDIFERFKSLVRYSGMIEYDKNNVNLYYGVKCDGTFEYGISYDNFLPLGKFKLSQSVIKWIVSMDLASASSLKKELVNLSYKDVLTLGRVKLDMSSFDPGYHEKRSLPTMVDRVITFGYHGVGRWEGGKIDDQQFLAIKSKFMDWVLSKKWGSKVLVSIQPTSYWLYIHVKLK